MENGTGRLHMDQLPNYVAHLWSTPSVADTTGGRLSRSKDRSDELLMRGQAKALSNALWPTPTSLSFGDSHQPGNSRSYNLTMERSSSLSSLLAPETSTDGAPSSPERRSLNPRFVEWLMGWPHEWTSFGCSEMALSRWRQHMRTALSSLASPSAALPPQLSLFG